MSEIKTRRGQPITGAKGQPITTGPRRPGARTVFNPGRHGAQSLLKLPRHIHFRKPKPTPPTWVGVTRFMDGKRPIFVKLVRRKNGVTAEATNVRGLKIQEKTGLRAMSAIEHANQMRKQRSAQIAAKRLQSLDKARAALRTQAKIKAALGKKR